MKTKAVMPAAASFATGFILPRYGRMEIIMAVFYNQANLSYNGGNTNSNIVTGEILEVLSVTKTAVSPTYGAGDTVTYVISIINTGNTPVTDLTVTDDLGRYSACDTTFVPLTYVEGSVKYYRNGVLGAAPSVTFDEALVFSGIDVPAEGNTTIIYSASANETAPLPEGSVITNTVNVSGNGVTAPVTATATINVRTEPVLTIAKGINPTTVTENSPLTYTFTIRNTGNRAAFATDNIVVTDTFAPILENITVTIDGVPAAEGTDYSYNSETGIFTTSAGRITVPAAEYTQNCENGEWTVTPGTAVVTVSGTV